MTNGDGYAGDVSSREAWEILERDPKAALVDVRTKPEWGFVGVPDLAPLGKHAVFISWQVYPGMQVDQRFAEHVSEAGLSKDDPILLLCRSGGRSRSAAKALTALGYRACFNIADGFEGGHDAQGHRGTKEGWKASDLPWKQN